MTSRTTAADSAVEQLIQRAKQADSDAAGELLECHRAYLVLLARRFLGPKLRVRVAESDLIQQTCLSALRNIEQFTGDSPEDFQAWLHKIHQRNIQDALRENYSAEKRTLEREQRLDSDCMRELTARTSRLSPSQRVLRSEAAARLAREIAALPESQAEAVRLRHLEGYTVADIAQTLNRSEQAVAGLLKRGLRALREQFPKEQP